MNVIFLMQAHTEITIGGVGNIISTPSRCNYKNRRWLFGSIRFSLAKDRGAYLVQCVNYELLLTVNVMLAKGKSAIVLCYSVREMHKEWEKWYDEKKQKEEQENSSTTSNTTTNTKENNKQKEKDTQSQQASSSNTTTTTSKVRQTSPLPRHM